MTISPHGSGDAGSQRIGDAERRAALSALQSHLSAGRLDLSEFETRSALVTSARTELDLQSVFHDLPGAAPLAVPAPVGTPAADPAATRRLAAVSLGLTAILAVVAYMLLRDRWEQAWLLFLAVPVLSLWTQLRQRKSPPSS